MSFPSRAVEKFESEISRRRGETRDEEFYASVQKTWLDIAEDAEDALVEKEVYSEKELKLNRQEAKSAEKPEYENVKKARFSLMELMERDKGLMDRGLEIIPTGRYDTVINNVDFVLAFPEAEDGAAGLGINIQTVSDMAWYEKKIKQISKNIDEGQVDDLESAVKYIENEELRGNPIPCLSIYIKQNMIPRLVDLMIKERGPLSEASNKIKIELLEDIRSQIFTRISHLREFINKSVLKENKEQVDQAQKLLGKLEKFYNLFK